MRASVVVFPGSNCDRDVYEALGRTAGSTPSLVRHDAVALPASDLIVLPGGFSYGDYLRCGALAARSPVMREVAAAAKRGVPILGICNGFQILTESGLLPGALVSNKSLRFMAKDVELEIVNSSSLFTRLYKKGEVITLPVANQGGCYVASAAVLQQLNEGDQVALRYAKDVNGSLQRIAGILDKTKRIFGLMPHPERRCEEITGGTDGQRFFETFMASIH